MIDSLRSDLRKLQYNITQYKNENEQLQQIKEQLLQQNQEFNAQMESYSNEKQQLTMTISQLESSINDYKIREGNTLETKKSYEQYYDSALEEIQKTNQSLITQLSELQNQHRKLQSDFKTLQDQNAGYRNTIEQYQKNEVINKKSYDEMKKQNESYATSIQSLQQKISHYSSMVDSYRTTINTQKNDNSRLSEQIRQLQQSSNTFMNDISYKNNKVLLDSLLSSLSSLIHNHELFEEQAYESIDSKDIPAIIQSRMTQMHERIKDYKEKNTELKLSNEKYKKQLKDIESDISILSPLTLLKKSMNDSILDLEYENSQSSNEYNCSYSNYINHTHNYHQFMNSDPQNQNPLYDTVSLYQTISTLPNRLFPLSVQIQLEPEEQQFLAATDNVIVVKSLKELVQVYAFLYNIIHYEYRKSQQQLSEMNHQIASAEQMVKEIQQLLLPFFNANDIHGEMTISVAIQQLIQKYNTQQSTIQQLKESLTHNSQQIQQWKSDANDNVKKANEYRQNYDLLLKEKNTLEEQLNVEKQKNSQFASQFSGLQATISDQNKKITALTNEKNNLQQNYYHLKSKYDEGQNQLSRIQQEKSQLEAQLGHMKQYEGDSKTKESYIQQLKNEINNYIQQYRELNQRYDDISTQLSQTLMENSKLKDEISFTIILSDNTVVHSAKEFKSRYDELLAKNQNIEKEIRRVQRDYDLLKNSSSSNNKEIQQLRSNVEKLQQSNEILSNKVEYEKIQTSMVKKLYDNLSGVLKNLSQDIKRNNLNNPTIQNLLKVNITTLIPLQYALQSLFDNYMENSVVDFNDMRTLILKIIDFEGFIESSFKEYERKIESLQGQLARYTSQSHNLKSY